MDDLSNDVERVEYLQSLLVSEATGGNGDNEHYVTLRREFLDNSNTNEFVPSFVRTNRNLAQFWQFIKHKFSTYAERRQYIWEQFQPLLLRLEQGAIVPSDNGISVSLQSFDSGEVHRSWQRALERRTSDPEGAITAARSLIETVCKHILDECKVQYETNADLSELYKLTAKELNLSPSQHTEPVFKQILGGCSAIVGGLGTLRNRLGDAHGKGKKLPVRPQIRHAELAVNLAGTLAVFLVETWESQNPSH
ncbi:MAG: hypothetical protein NPIRA05_19960 [Nitrospirales bacterium]|nr:MAG: hypothetical protein NPIRA05_19960 [Nitrospirales bacterium]